MATKQQQIAAFLVAQGFSRPADPYGSWLPVMPSPALHWRYVQPPTIEELARELLQMSEFRALQLGTWFNTTDGQVITEAVEMVIPPIYRQDVELLVEGLKLAASLQQAEGQQVAGRLALGVVVIATLAVIATMSRGRRT